MQKIIVVLFVQMVFYSLNAQIGQQPGTLKNITPISSPFQSTIRHTRAVVIGISDYQHPAIPDLRFAHKDAEAFVGWLRSASGGSLVDSQMIVLLNEQATGAAVADAIGWLASVSGEGDQAIIYFSGHCDVEIQSRSQLGFLLCWDSGPNVYMRGGAYSLFYLQEMVSTLTERNRSHVLLITDACHAGKLSGNALRGTQMANANLAQQYAEEIKILSCQPNEYSLEGEQWGGGRGVFSYHLVEGLTGLADANEDRQIQLLEIERYLEDHVVREVYPLVQVPMTVGAKLDPVARVSSNALIELMAQKKNQLPQLTNIRGKIMGSLLYSTTDSNIQAIYRAFEKTLADRHFFEPANDNAEYYYQKLLSESSIASEHPFLTRRYAVALQDDAQQCINALLSTAPDQLHRTRALLFERYKDFPLRLHRAAELLGEKHYMYNNLKGREQLFTGVLRYLQCMANKTPSIEQGREVLGYYQKAMEFEPEMPLTPFFMSLCYGKIMHDSESARQSAEQAVSLAGTWTAPYLYLAYFLSREFKQFEAAKGYLDQVTAMDSTNAELWKGWVAWYTYQGKLPQALMAAEKATTLAPEDPYNWLNLGNLKQSQYKFEEAEAALLKSIALDSNQQLAYYYLGKNYQRWKKPEQAEVFYLKAVSLDPESELARSSLAGFYLGLERYKDAEAQYLELIRYSDPNADTWLKLSYVSTQNGKAEKGLEYLENALKKGFRDRKQIEEAEGFAPLRALPGYAVVIRQYFKE